MKKILMGLSTVLLFTVLLLTMPSEDIKAKAVSDLYQLPAPIIDVFPDEGLATDMAKNLQKDSVNDVIDQDDLDTLKILGFETESITNDSMKLLERAMFNNVTDVGIMEFGEELTEFPDITTIPHLETLLFNKPPETLTRNLSLPDYQNYPEMDSITLSGNNLIGSIPDFTGMPDLKHLSITDMSIRSDEIPDFKNIPLLLTLDLSGNQVTTIPDFQNTPELLELVLGENQINDIPDFQNIPNLITLDLSFNNLTKTMTNFTHLPHLINLDLDYNHLNELPSNVLSSTFVENQKGTVPDQTINQGETCTIQLPIYSQMAEINMLVNPEIKGFYAADIPQYVSATSNADTETITLDTSELSPGVYKFNVQFNMAYPVTNEGCVYDWELTIN
ncbi:TPA: internalin N-terminal domain-containing protein [Listeria monocytogenes]|nr:cell surface protein [Listeria monocytogenes]EKA2552488.1 leucine-rich repeat domain-containing protein [Listeria monocytogenes]EKA2555622.1 leucine-rich repeat domain-containing protein [Listeria monocytogenes]EKA2558766.1 leucine-rich repeat domain-containing protein [Listeria monocytogenes]EKA2561890.1 leucine-rich repeat domain-containing protein [Listeria monocytogenes]